MFIFVLHSPKSLMLVHSPSECKTWLSCLQLHCKVRPKVAVASRLSFLHMQVSEATDPGKVEISPGCVGKRGPCLPSIKCPCFLPPSSFPPHTTTTRARVEITSLVSAISATFQDITSKLYPSSMHRIAIVGARLRSFTLMCRHCRQHLSLRSTSSYPFLSIQRLIRTTRLLSTRKRTWPAALAPCRALA